MGLPRDLNDYFEEIREEAQNKQKYGKEKSNEALHNLMIFATKGFHSLLNADTTKLPNKNSIVMCAAKKGLKLYNGYKYNTKIIDNMNKIPVNYFKGVKYHEKYKEYRMFTKEIKISLFFKETFEKLNEKRLKKIVEERELKNSILKFENKIYAARCFPPKLKQVIFIRDNFTCQNCLKPKDILIKEGLYLEINHIKAWEDGGKTTLHNGETVCSNCNKGIHYAKEYTNKNGA